jgi:hypothetical protein
MARISRFVGVLAALGANVALTAVAAEPAKTTPPAGIGTAGVAQTGDSAQQEARRKRIESLRAVILGDDRAARIAAFEAALTGGDAALRKVAVELAFDSRDPVLSNLALRDWLSRTKEAPVQLFATKEEPGSVSVLQNLGPLNLKIHSFDPAAGAVSGQLSAPGYDVSRDGAAAGTLAQTTLIFNTFGCQLALQLSDQRMLDGLYRCRSLPALLARIAPD